MLASLGPARGAAGVHEKKRRFRWHGYRLDFLAGIIFQHFIHKKVAAFDHRLGGSILSAMPPPHQYLIYLLAFFRRLGHGQIGLFFVVSQCSAAIVAINRNQHPAAGVSRTQTAGLSAKSADRKSTR